MEIDWLHVLAAVINLLILYALMKHFFFDKVEKVIGERQSDIQSKIDKADEDTEKARTLLLENERILRSAKDEAKKITESQKHKADKVYEEIVDQAKNEAQTLLDRASVEINREKEKAEQEIREQVVDLAVLISAKALEESIDEDKHRKLINDFIAKVGI
ncbi:MULTISPECIES: F0F1 ATP synthase subunit B [Clostridium]|uniref:ATP synthase subunit b n=1 Tax=Clostridium manihotivorum TaxID=2320868 RepID=A0A410E1Q8_9CLOT|nr:MULTISPECIES: F0F1 ATP synthase subunit B [Clostridium]QAA35241.1 ATP synthase F0 subunit B [Clostridium manihotivorum]